MRKESLIALLVCGCLSSSALLSAADWSWNPFKSRTKAAADQTIPIRTSGLSVSRDPFLNTSNRQESTGQTSFESQQSQQGAGPITNATYRMILEESRNYPPDVRQKFVRGFSKLTDSEARKRIERIRRSRAEQISPATSTVAARDYSANASWEQMSYEQPTANAVQKPDHSAPGVAAAKSTLPDWSQYAQQLPGRASTTPAAKTSVQKRAEPFPKLAGTDDPFTAATATGSQSGVARVPRQTPAPSGIRITPTGHTAAQQLPKIRPATVANDQSHYVTRYVPGSSTAQPNLSRPYDGQHAGSTDNSAATEIEQQDLEQLIAQLESLAQRSQPGTTEASMQRHVTTHVELRLLYLISDEKDRALTAIPGLSQEEQVFWTRIFWGLTNYLDQSSASSKAERTTVALDQLRHAILALQGDAGLKIRNVEFCSEIENFGNYTRYDRDEFTAGQEILLYSELENFRSEQIDSGLYRTLLKSSIQIRKAGNAGELIDEVPYNPTEDLCRSQRKDFMQGFRYRLPQRLSAGAYVLELVIEDQLSGKSAQSSLNFVVK